MSCDFCVENTLSAHDIRHPRMSHVVHDESVAIRTADWRGVNMQKLQISCPTLSDANVKSMFSHQRPCDVLLLEFKVNFENLRSNLFAPNLCRYPMMDSILVSVHNTGLIRAHFCVADGKRQPGDSRDLLHRGVGAGMFNHPPTPDDGSAGASKATLQTSAEFENLQQ